MRRYPSSNRYLSRHRFLFSVQWKLPYNFLSPMILRLFHLAIPFIWPLLGCVSIFGVILLFPTGEVLKKIEKIRMFGDGKHPNCPSYKTYLHCG